MATRDPNLISESIIQAGPNVAIVRETASENGSEFKISNREEIPANLHSDILEKAKKFEAKK